MMDRIANGWNMAENHVFQFDFLNDDFSKCPEELQAVLNDPEKRKKLVIYINPPYLEIAGTKLGANLNNTHDKYADKLAVANREVYAQFLIRIYYEIPTCRIGVFSKIKALQGSNFAMFRNCFQAKLDRIFLVPADTFDNVTGKFPIGFQIYDTSEPEVFAGTTADAYDRNGSFIGSKEILLPTKGKYFSNWVTSFKTAEGLLLGWFDRCTYNDFQNQKLLNIQNDKPINNTQPRGAYITSENLLPFSIAFGVRLCISSDWLNDRDQFLYPNDGWQKDKEFQTNCMIFTLFHGQNRITSQQGINHWIPFTREQVGCRKTFKSTFMSDYLAHHDFATTNQQKESDLFDSQQGSIQHELSKNEIHENSCEIHGNSCKGIQQFMSPEAQAVYDAGLALWRYYHSQPNALADASFYDIRLHFQGTNDRGNMNAKSDDATYTALIADLRDKMKRLAKCIEPKVYEYGFLK